MQCGQIRPSKREGHTEETQGLPVRHSREVMATLVQVTEGAPRELHVERLCPLPLSVPGSPVWQARPLCEALEAGVAGLGSQGREAGPAQGEGSGVREPQVSRAVWSPGKEPELAGRPVLTDERAQLVRQLPGACGQHLPPHVLEDHRPGLEVHHEHGHQLRLGPLQLRLRRNPPPHGSA